MSPRQSRRAHAALFWPRFESSGAFVRSIIGALSCQAGGARGDDHGTSRGFPGEGLPDHPERPAPVFVAGLRLAQHQGQPPIDPASSLTLPHLPPGNTRKRRGQARPGGRRARL